MATPTTNASAAAPKDIEWDEAHIDDAQKRLKEMFLQLRQLRNTIPGIIDSLTSPGLTAEQLVDDVKKSGYRSQNDIKEFKRLWADPEVQKVFEHVKESRAKNGAGITPFRITQHPEWMTRD